MKKKKRWNQLMPIDFHVLLGICYIDDDSDALLRLAIEEVDQF